MPDSDFQNFNFDWGWIFNPAGATYRTMKKIDSNTQANKKRQSENKALHKSQSDNSAEIQLLREEIELMRLNNEKNALLTTEGGNSDSVAAPDNTKTMLMVGIVAAGIGILWYLKNDKK